MKIVGLRVVRGLDWKWGDQDGGEGSVGTVVGFKEERGVKGALSKVLDKLKSGLVKVVWDCGVQAVYRAGYQGCYDLLIVDDAARRVKHQNTNCQLCDVKEIVGMRWECTECKSNFCSSCFYQIDKRHDHLNAFKRYISNDLNSEPLIVFVDKPGKKRLHLRGIFPGAKVKRGKNWSYGDEDGEQLIGDVMPTTGSTVLKGKVDVKFRSSDTIFTYRRGKQGKMDLKAVEAATGGRYLPEWLPTLKVITKKESTEPSANHFSVGDHVQIVTTVTEMREKQVEHGGWNESMTKAIGEAGTVFKVGSDGIIHVNFEKLDQKLCLNPTVVKKLTTFSIGLIVRVRDDVDTLKTIKTQLGSDGSKVIYAMAGKTGRVTKVEIDEDSGERVNLEVIKESSLKPLPAMKPEWLEIVPVAFKLHENLYKIKADLGNLFVGAAQEGDSHLLEELLENHKVSVDVDHKSTPGLTALHLACRKGHLQVVEWLLEQKANIEKVDDKGRTALYHAVKAGEEKVLQFLIQKGADLDTVSKRRGLTALQKAIANRHGKCAEILIENGCNVNHQDKDGDTPLHKATYMMKNSLVLDGDAPTVLDALIHSGRVDLNIRNKEGLGVLHVAVGVGNLRVVQYFLSLDNAAEFVLEMIPKKKLNVLHIACINGYFEIADMLLKFVQKLDENSMEEGVFNSFLNAKDQNDQTPLMMAAMGNHYSLIELLVETIAGVNATDKDGDTAISLIMKKVGKNQSKSPIPTSSDSPVIHKIYEAIYSTPMFSEAIAKHPSLSAACYLISNGGDPEAGGALSKSSDTTVNNILRSFVPEDPDNSRSAAGNQGTNCVLCGRSSTPVLYNCCNKECSLFCSDCCQKIIICPCCGVRQRRPTKNASSSLELSSSPPDTFINISSPLSIEFEGHDELIDSQVSSSSLSISMAPSGNVIKQSESILKDESPDTGSESSLPLNSFTGFSIPATPPGSKQHVTDESGSCSEKQSQWTLKRNGSRRNIDLLLDVHGNTFTKRSPNIWQCTKKSDISQRNKCSALVKEKKLSNGTIKYEILKAEHKHAAPSASQLANITNIRPQSSVNQRNGASKAAAGKRKGRNIAREKASTSESVCMMTRSMKKKRPLRDKCHGKDAFKKGK